MATRLTVPVYFGGGDEPAPRLRSDANVWSVNSSIQARISKIGKRNEV
jgi:hypothetical protein